jgi:hypothetical protein
VEFQAQNELTYVYGAFDRNEDQVLRSGSIVAVSLLLESGRSVLWADSKAILKQVKTEAESTFTEAS